MKKNNVLAIIAMLVLVISIGVFGMFIYQKYQNKDNKEINVSFEKVNQLFKETIDHPINVLQGFEQYPNKTSLNIEEINPDYFAYMLLKSTKMEKAQICGTAHEENLKKMHIISEIDEGQFDCRSDIFYRIDSIKEASKEIFGKELPQLTIKTTDRNASYFILKMVVLQ